MRRHRTLPILLLTIALGACGARGPLTLPPQAKAPVNTAAPQSVPADLNTAKDPAQ